MVERGNNAPAVSFTDVSPSSWSASVIERSARMGIVSGFGDGAVKLEGNVTRAEFATMMVRAFGLASGGGAKIRKGIGRRMRLRP
ncbi:S-layer homology domain-containing protein [Paenibacillus piri]|uniref:S-layer homology domain-containing protein n=1 Tax=Paenibacillus piri TaxID=2547395 RepID=A0A4R5KR57_9BACL|nr:S-layer homology domain-containing protein [Paenibacillus piri]